LTRGGWLRRLGIAETPATVLVERSRVFLAPARRLRLSDG